MNKEIHKKFGKPEFIVSFPWLVAYLKKSRAKLLVVGIVGLSLGWLIYATSPKIFEATFVLRLPIANAISSEGEIQKHIIRPIPTALDAKKALLGPEKFSVKTMESCGFKDSNMDRKSLVHAISSNIVSYESGLQVTIRLPGEYIVKECAAQILDDLISFANKEKDKYVAYAIRSSSPNNPMLVNEAAQLTAPIRISDSVVAPRFWHLLLGCFFASLLLSCLLDWLVYLWRRALPKP